MRREFCAEQSRIENLRCVHFEEENESQYGKQLWYFEAIGIDPVGRRHMLYGALEFSVQFGLLEPSQTALFEESEHRQKFLDSETRNSSVGLWQHYTTRFWVKTACLGIVVTAMMWVTILLNHIMR